MNVKGAYAAGMLSALLALTSYAGADDQDDKTGHQQMPAKSPAMSADKMTSSAGSKALHDSMMKSMEKMRDMKPSGNTDDDFASMMIAHHEMGIAMSKAEIENGKDPEMQKKARDIIAASEKDIPRLKKWQTKQD